MRRRLVGAGVLDVAWLLATVANTLRRSLRGAVSRQVADLTACNALVGQSTLTLKPENLQL